MGQPFFCENTSYVENGQIYIKLAWFTGLDTKVYPNGRDYYIQWNNVLGGGIDTYFSSSTLMVKLTLSNIEPTIDYTFTLTAEGESGSDTVVVRSAQASGDPPYEWRCSFQPSILHQWIWDYNSGSWAAQAGTCAACALVSLKQIHEYSEGKGVEQYSIGWLFGNRLPSQLQGEELNNEAVLTQLKNDGTPVYTFIPESVKRGWPDNYTYYDKYGLPGAKNTISAIYNDIIDSARPQRIQSFTKYTTWTITDLRRIIYNNQCAIITINLYDNFYESENNGGWIPKYHSGSFRTGHMMVVLGWKYVNNQFYFICQNSWGDWVGDSGLFYLPADNNFTSGWWEIVDGNYPYPSPPIPSAPLIDTSYGNNSDGRFEGGFILKWGASSGATKYKVKVRRGYDSNIQEFSFGNTTSGMVYGLQYGVTYYLSVCAGNNYNSYSAYSSENIGTTAPQTPTISLGTTTSNSITINTGSMSGNYDKIRIYRQDSGIYLECDANNSVTFTGLTTGQSYSFYAKSRFTINNTTIWSANQSNTITAKSSSPRPIDWSWTTAERNAFNNHGAVTTLTWDRWNSFVDKIVEFRNYKGLTEYVTVGGTSYHITNAKVSSSNKTLTALKFNIARTAIGNMNSTGITDRVPGDIVYGSYFITLEDKLKGIT